MRRQANVSAKHHPATPDGRYFVVRGRLWRPADPRLDPGGREELVSELMAARRAVRDAGNVDERGPVWWDDGAPDYNRRLAKNTPYAEWFAGLEEDERPPPRRTTPFPSPAREATTSRPNVCRRR